ncbi:sodium-coupled monocarboxylate transporter 2-like isoform X1 [Varroa jacobsoni]|nr:sodium-coupled monocarboxylate transporter 2-like isoform X1 [Varroa jacobsoni]
MIFVTIGSYVFMLATTASFFVPIFYELGVNTCYQYLELRFSRLVRMAAVVLYIIEMLIYMSVSLYAPALAISSITGIKLWTTVCAISIVCTLYTSVGGIKAVVYTNAFQLVVMLIAMIVIVISGYAHLGGFNRVWKIAERGKRIHFTDFRFDPTVRHTVWGLVIGAAISNMGSYATNNMMVLRYFTVSSLNAAKWAVWMNLPLLVAVLSLSCLSGLLMFARYHACDPIANKQVTSSDQLLPYFILDVLGATTGMSGLFVAGIFAASLSSISSAVNALCNVFYIDIVLICWPSISSETGAKVIVGLGAVFSLLAIILVVGTSSMGQVLPATVAINSSVGAPLFGLFFVGIFFPTAFTLTHLTVRSCVENFPSANYSTTVATPLTAENLPFIYRLSYLWMSSISVFIQVVVSLLVSKITGSNDPTKMNPNLICTPFDSCPCLSDEIKTILNFGVGKHFDVLSRAEAEKLTFGDVLGSARMKRPEVEESSDLTTMPSESSDTITNIGSRIS